MRQPAELPDLGGEGQMWRKVLDLADVRDRDWTLVGALMVSLHASMADLVMPRTTQDIDAVVEVRGVANEPRSFTQQLTALG